MKGGRRYVFPYSCFRITVTSHLFCQPDPVIPFMATISVENPVILPFHSVIPRKCFTGTGRREMLKTATHIAAGVEEDGKIGADGGASNRRSQLPAD
jgi:hypothetical protein